MAVNQIFFSYSFKDEDKVLKIREMIENIFDENGNQKYSVFMASDPIRGNKSGKSWSAQEKVEMMNSFLIIYFLSENSIMSDGASQELEFYFNTMRGDDGTEKFLYISLNGKSMRRNVLDYIKGNRQFVSNLRIEEAINRYINLLDEPDFRDNHLFIDYNDEYLKDRLSNTVLEMYNEYNGIHEDKYQNIINKLEKLEEQEVVEKKIPKKEELKVIKKEIKGQEKEKKKTEKRRVDVSLADIFKQVEDPEEVILNKQAIQECFEQYNIKGKIGNYYIGPSITLYEIELEPTERINKFLLIKEDLFLKVGGRVRLIAPIPGKSVCGIEIPNKNRKLLKFGELLTEDFLEKGNSFTCVMGKNSYNEIKEYDVSKMPHCLISGTIGSGAVNILNTIIVSLLMKYSPNELRLVLADPHRVEFSTYKDIPHLLYPVVEEAEIGTLVFKEIYEEIEKRYKTLQENNCKNIYEYNEDRFEKMPYILIVINEYADFVLIDREVESYIAKIVQIGRAVGVHFVLYTQRPSVDILTGVLKANFATRITGVVNSYIDSRTIIDEGGAECLLGKGDSIVKFQGISERVQSAFISEKELSTFCEAICNKYGQKKLPIKKVENNNTDLIENVIDYLYETKKVSISMLQRKFNIGYSRGVRILETLLDLCVVKRDGAFAIPIVEKEDAINIVGISGVEL